ncbi:MAG: hypothetical protein LQ342_002305 [Letrouitia transgressa]|nr:MAG: hypothetical protein LQ342_002305 [Letrouitia transgressa]
MSRRVFDVGLDVGRIKNGLKVYTDNKRTKSHHRSASASDARPDGITGQQLAVVPGLKGKSSDSNIRTSDSDKAAFTDGNIRQSSPSSPTPNGFLPPSQDSSNMDNEPPLDDHIEASQNTPDEYHNFDLRPPPPNKPLKFLDRLSDQLFSVEHLQILLRDPSFFMRFTAFLNRYMPQTTSILARYLEAQKAIKAVEYANAVAEAIKPIPGDQATQTVCAAAALDATFEGRSRKALEHLVDDVLPAYITQSFTKLVTESMVREITGTTMPVMRELVGGLAEVFCLSDPSMRDNPIIYASEEFYQTTQYGRDYVLGRNCRFLQGPHTDRRTVARIRNAVRAGQESFETILNYRRDGSPFMNLVMIAPLYDNRGKVRYFLGAQVEISGLIEDGRGLDSFERLLTENKRNRRSDYSDAKSRKSVKALDELGQMLNVDESSVFQSQGHSRASSVRDGDYGGQSARDRREYSSRRPRRVLGNDDLEAELAKDEEAMKMTSLGPSGKLPGVYQNYLLVRPHPSLRIIFVSSALRIPGLLQSPFLDRIGGPQHVRSGLAEAFEHGEAITAKVTWLVQPEKAENAPSGSTPNTSINSNNNRQLQRTATRYVSCTPLLGSDDRVGVWMVVMVESEPVTGSLVSRSRMGNQQGPEVPGSPAEYETQERVDGAGGSRPGSKREKDGPGRMYADFMRNQRMPVAPMTPPAGTGKVLEVDGETEGGA